MNKQEMLLAATDPDRTPFDYIVIGSGAGGGPLAARLAENGARVLVVEAGIDAITEREPDTEEATIFEAPLLHGHAVEDPSIAWDFRVRHYDDAKVQRRDSKAVPDREEPKRATVHKPRSAALGGCTAHHAMITAYGCDDAWEGIRELTGDDSWHPDRMRRYFQRIENCLYRRPFTALGRLWRRVVAFFSPQPLEVLPGEHGRGGWLTTVVTDPTTALGDHQLVGVLAGAFKGAKRAGLAKIQHLAKAIGTAALDGYLDVNDAVRWRAGAEGVRLIPLGTRNGRRYGVRERLLEVAKRHPDRLVIATETHVTKILLRDEKGGPAPRAIGVECRVGRHLYRASPRHVEATREHRSVSYHARREVIVAGGAFNSPQLLMLSGIGPRDHLEKVGVACRVPLPGVGANLQDRYEVCVVSRLREPFSTLQGVGFDPTDQNDAQLRAWRHRDARSLYGSNGGALAILKKTKPELDAPDVFLFAAPAMFRGYYPGWAKDLLRKPGHGSAPGETPGPADNRNLLSWVILKARTKNHAGTVRLRSADPFATPIVTHRHFGEGAAPGDREHAGAEEDLEAMVEAVRFARTLNARLGPAQEEELLPGAAVPDGSRELEEWIRNEAWGHHPCGTCRIGSDRWQPTPTGLQDPFAVLDSRFRVHGVRGLRVVDASVFPDIPGYFLVTPIYCVSEKAAEDILAEFAEYPLPLEQAEAGAIANRRAIAARQDHDDEDATGAAVRGPGTAPLGGAVANVAADSAALARLPADCVGLALSGGGIRAATFSLGVIQALAQRRRLRDVDVLSTVSGGGYIGSFLGRLFQRNSVTVQGNPAIAVEQELRGESAAVAWLRSQADYISASGPVAGRQNLATYLRNLVSLHLVLATFAVALFGLLRGGQDWLAGSLAASAGFGPFTTTLLWNVALGGLLLAVLPVGVAFWSTPRNGRDELYGTWPIVAAFTVLLASAYAMQFDGVRSVAIVCSVIVAASFVWLEIARLNSRLSDHDLGARKLSMPVGTIVRNRLTRTLGELLKLLAFVVVWAAIDSSARYLAAAEVAGTALPMLCGGAAGLWTILSGVIVMANAWVRRLENAVRGDATGMMRAVWCTTAVVGYAVAAGALLAIAIIVHALFDRDATEAWFVTAVALVVSAVISRAFGFVNASSVHSAYAARLTRTFLGASNPERIHKRADAVADDVSLAHPKDDVAFSEYHPEANGGPLHIVNACLNETVDYRSYRDQRDRYGMALACGPCGISLGRRIHGLWRPVRDGEAGAAGRRGAAVEPLLVTVDQYHPFRTADGGANPVEDLSLGAWMAISGAAFSTGRGRNTSTGRSLVAGLANTRLGYWWDTDPQGSATERTRWPNLWQAIRHLPRHLYRVQSMLLTEFRGRFLGPNGRHWYLSDGGHFDNTGLYELLRRRVPFVIACDAGEDPQSRMEDYATIVHLARTDFRAEMEFLSRTPGGGADWLAFGPDAASIPAWIQSWLDPNEIGGLADLGREGGRHAVLARVRYASGGETWVIVLKATLTGDEPLDLRFYKNEEPAFPNQPTLDQRFDSLQWECYRRLGEHIGCRVLRRVPAAPPGASGSPPCAIASATAAAR